ncbi:hypothetical protein DIPPA_04469 [Diplonema papillatum]|nr:hypothetical protein DIPPA_04469 [Diplonema papillatum]
MASRSGAPTHKIRTPKERLASGECITRRLTKQANSPAGLILRQWKRGILEIRGVQEGLPAEDQNFTTHTGYLLIGINGRPVETVVDVGDVLKAATDVTLSLALPSPGDIPKEAKRSAMSKTGVTYAMSNPNPSFGHDSPSRGSLSRPSGRFRPGDRCEVYYGAEDGITQGIWYPCEVTAILHDLTYCVLFDTGEAAEGVASHSMRMLGSTTTSPMASPRQEIRKDERVEVFYGPDEDGWYPAIVSFRNRDGTFTVRFDSGEISEGVSRDYIRPVVEDDYSSFHHSVRSEGVTPHLGVGSAAEVLWEGKEWTPSVIKAFHPMTNMYDVDWMDGTETLGVLARDVRPGQPASTRGW